MLSIVSLLIAVAVIAPGVHVLRADLDEISLGAAESTMRGTIVGVLRTTMSEHFGGEARPVYAYTVARSDMPMGVPLIAYATLVHAVNPRVRFH